MFFVEFSSETRLFRYFSNHVLRTPYFWKYITYEDHLFFKKIKIWSKDEKRRKKLQKCFCFLEYCIWIGCAKLSLLRREYLPSVVIILTDSCKTLHITKRDFCTSTSFAVIINYNKSAVVQILAVFRIVYHVACRTVFWNGTF